MRLPKSLSPMYSWMNLEPASKMKTPPAMKKTTSCFISMAIVPNIPPRASEPVSPMKMLAG